MTDIQGLREHILARNRASRSQQSPLRQAIHPPHPHQSLAYTAVITSSEGKIRLKSAEAATPVAALVALLDTTARILDDMFVKGGERVYEGETLQVCADGSRVAREVEGAPPSPVDDEFEENVDAEVEESLDVNVTDASQPQPQAQQNGTTTPLVAKRPRGRPKKVKDLGQRRECLTMAKRPPGKPKKMVEKRGPGRPRKSVVPAEAAVGETAAVAKRGPGRPRKIAAEHAVSLQQSEQWM